jgi:hypothetical protein
MSDIDSITPLPLEPELLRAYIEKLPPEVVKQFVNNWRGPTENLERSETENSILSELLRRNAQLQTDVGQPDDSFLRPPNPGTDY